MGNSNLTASYQIQLKNEILYILSLQQIKPSVTFSQLLRPTNIVHTHISPHTQQQTYFLLITTTFEQYQTRTSHSFIDQSQVFECQYFTVKIGAFNNNKSFLIFIVGGSKAILTILFQKLITRQKIKKSVPLQIVTD
eukprot:TRINITY_DN34388_c0_g1_i6.p2 TRINITY_DN34388_c0_g1~~TRINITY_DN34388_c0_g1_i6.p2  ORF type:complete len:149 (+),score=2.03 TRINITY_DN34388_c0_g1_i6:37-447(+)